VRIVKLKKSKSLNSSTLFFFYHFHHRAFGDAHHVLLASLDWATCVDGGGEGYFSFSIFQCLFIMELNIALRKFFYTIKYS